MEIRKEVLALAKAASTDMARPVLECIALSANGQAAATDSYVAVLLPPTIPNKEPGDLMLLPRALTTIARKKPLCVEASEDDGRVTLSVQYVNGGKINYSLPRVEGAFPNVTRLVGKTLAEPTVASIRLDAKLLRDLAGLLSSLCRNGREQGVVMELRAQTSAVSFIGEDEDGREVVALLMPMEYHKPEPSTWLKDIVASGKE